GMGLVERCQTAGTPALRPLVVAPTHPKLTCGSRMTGDRHVRFCESPGVRVPRATHLLRLNQLEIYFSVVQRKVLNPNVSSTSRPGPSPDPTGRYPRRPEPAGLWST